MNFFAPLFLLFTLTSVASAYNPTKVQPDQPYDLIKIEGDPYIQREYLGTLEDYPEMFELTTDVSFDLNIMIRQKASKNASSFGMIIVRENNDDGGVEEIGRLNQPLQEWKEEVDASFGITFLESSVFEKQITPGTYRIEISTPDNKGDYMLVVGDEPVSPSYFKTLAHIYTTQQHFGYTPFHLLFSSYVYYVIGILLVLYGIYRTWQYKKRL